MVLERLEQQGVFLSPVTWERREYRFHQLFADYLRDRLERSDLAQFSALQRRAAQWFAERGMVADAVNHAILSGDDMLLAEILEEAGGWRLIPQGLQGVVRSEEHTSELQSLMRISYAVFCLKKKKRKPRRQVYQSSHKV